MHIAADSEQREQGKEPEDESGNGALLNLALSGPGWPGRGGAIGLEHRPAGLAWPARPLESGPAGLLRPAGLLLRAAGLPGRMLRPAGLPGRTGLFRGLPGPAVRAWPTAGRAVGRLVTRRAGLR
ncbi:MAG TPA: hypothetical protein VMK13_17620 [Streptosporangiaceae bacterium]|nr:hypothetical protein [Streptosporangiaceae bacterium]